MDVFDLYAKISLDTKGYEKDLKDAGSKFSAFGDGLKSAAGKIGDILAGIGKVAAASIGAGAAAMTALTKQTLDAVGNFEQLEGGARKIFDEMDFDKISKDAKNAYKELNMSASEYLESINLAGATFAMTMGDEKGYDTARQGMLAIADFASGTGKNLAELNQKFQLITRSATSYQSIADQFAGILPQTTADFMEAAQAAGLLSTEYKELKDIPVAEYQQAVTQMIVDGVDKLGLSQNTLRESTETLTGSFAMAKAAWDNFLTGQSDTKTFTQAFSSAIEQTTSKLNTIIPRLTTGLTQIVNQLAPEIPPILEQTLPSIITGTTTLLTGLADQLPDLLTTVLPSISEGIINVTTAIIGALPDMITALKQSIPIVIDTIMSKKDELFQAGKDIIKALFPKGLDGVTEIASKATEVVTNFALQISNPDTLTKVFNTGLDIISAIADGLLSDESIDRIIVAIPQVIQNLATAITNFLSGENGEGGLYEATYNIIDKLCDYLEDKENQEQFEQAAIDCLISLGDFLVENTWRLAEFAVKIGQRLAEMIIQAFMDNFISLFDSEYGWMEEYMNSDTNLTYDEWAENKRNSERAENTTSQSYLDSEMLIGGGAGGSQAEAAFWRSQHIHGYATGGVFNRPTYAMIGEDGAEAVMPLEKNTGWIDQLANRLNRSNSSTVVIEQVIINAPTGNAEDISAAFVTGVDEKMRNLQILQGRSVGEPIWS